MLGRRRRRRRLQPARAARRARRGARSRCCARTAATSARSARRSARPTSGPRSPRTPTSRGGSIELFAARLDPTRPAAAATRRGRARRRDHRRARRGRQPRRGPHPARAAAPRARDAAHQLVPDRRRRPAAAVRRAEARSRRRCPTCRCPARCSRSSCTRRASRACTCAPGAVARGGIRWSDRREDFRTEVLGLMKAQKVKNAVIVPSGAKGGFVVKQPPADPGAAARRGRGVLPALHRRAARRHRQPRERRRRHVDGRAARRRSCATTATIRTSSSRPTRAPPRSPTSPTRSRVARGFWLGDAFASGGSHGYDHKEMGITARGAWESVRRHFRHLGDRSRPRRLHRRRHRRHVGRRVRQRHAALAPHPARRRVRPPPRVPRSRIPTPSRRSQERKRLFDLPRSSWADYDAALISPGGGVYPRTAEVDRDHRPRCATGSASTPAIAALHARRADPRRSCARRSTCSTTAASAPT